ncbi:Uncharacterized protein Rs2_04839 [Raphanus sativus]|nr:Uncharacterized protein Rs2_04839 [Raphanus sativus]
MANVEGEMNAVNHDGIEDSAPAKLEEEMNAVNHEGIEDTTAMKLEGELNAVNHESGVEDLAAVAVKKTKGHTHDIPDELVDDLRDPEDEWIDDAPYVDVNEYESDENEYDSDEYESKVHFNEYVEYLQNHNNDSN